MGASTSSSADTTPPVESSRLVDEKGKPAADNTPKPLDKLFYALHVPRLIGAVHIILGHYRTAETYDSLSATLGLSVWWVDFFFMLSSFGAAHSRMHKVSLERIATEEPILPSPTGLLRRLAAIYPTFLVAFLLSWMGRCLATRGDCETPYAFTCYHPAQLILEGLGIRDWFPYVGLIPQPPEAGQGHQLAYNEPAWFVSALLFCYLFERAFIRLAAMGQVYAGKGNVPWATIVGVGLYLVTSPTANFPFTWANSCSIAALKALHKYFCGSVLAAYLHSRADAGYEPNWLMRFAATGSLLVFIGLLFLNFAFDPDSSRDLCVRIRDAGATLVLYTLMIAGLAGNADPIARCLNALPPWLNDLARDLSGGVYLLQEPVAIIIFLCFPTGAVALCPRDNQYWPFTDGKHVQQHYFLPIMLPSLFAAAALVHFGWQKPIAQAVGRRLKGS